MNLKNAGFVLCVFFLAACVESDLVEQQRPSDVGLSEKGMESFNGTCLGDEFEECFVWKSSSNTSIRGNYFRGVVQVRFRVLSGVYTAASVVATRLDIVLGWKNLMSREMGIIVYDSTEGQFVGTANDYQSSLSGKTLENVHVRDFAWHYATPSLYITEEIMCWQFDLFVAFLHEKTMGRVDSSVQHVTFDKAELMFGGSTCYFVPVETPFPVLSNTTSTLVVPDSTPAPTASDTNDCKRYVIISVVTTCIASFAVVLLSCFIYLVFLRITETPSDTEDDPSSF